jgi:iron(III) transport system ATP-binding protein
MTRVAPTSVEFRRVSKRYGTVTAVDDISFTIDPGKLVTLLGPSGCGKTTTLRLIAGLEMASEGQILIGGRDVTRASAADRDVSMVFQSYALFPHMSVIDNVAYGPTVSGAGRSRAREMALEKLALVGLKGLERRMPSELSGGQQQRVAAARALMSRPEIVFADEPTGNLDSTSGAEVLSLLRRSVDEHHQTIVMVTHDPVAAAYTDRVVFLADGRVVDELRRPTRESVLEEMGKLTARAMR